MNANDLMARVGDGLGVRRVFGEAVEHQGVLVIPVAVSVGGGGGGAGPDGTGEGGGFGGLVRGIGVYTVEAGRVRFVPAIDTTALAAMGVVLVGLALRSRRRGR